MRGWIIGLAAFVAAGGACAAGPETPAQTANWSTYAHPELGFSIDAPAAPVSATRTSQSEGGPVVSTLFNIDVGEGGGVILSVGDYRGVKDLPEAQKGLDGAVSGAVANMGATLLSSTPIKVDGYDGREVSARVDPEGLLVKGRIVYAGKRLYQLMAIGPASSGVPADFARVESSFRIIKP